MLCYILVAWATMATVMFLECEPLTWASRMEQTRTHFFASEDDDSIADFLKMTDCKMDAKTNCWREIELYVHNRFINFAMIFDCLYPVMIGSTVAFLLRA